MKQATFKTQFIEAPGILVLAMPDVCYLLYKRQDADVQTALRQICAFYIENGNVTIFGLDAVRRMLEGEQESGFVKLDELERIQRVCKNGSRVGGNC